MLLFEMLLEKQTVFGNHLDLNVAKVENAADLRRRG
jgi:hypothetical protein